MTPAERLAAIAARADAARREPWVTGWEGQSYVVREPGGWCVAEATIALNIGEDAQSAEFRESCHTADLDFIAAARQDVPDLLRFAQAVLALCDARDGIGSDYTEWDVCIATDELRRLADEHLGGGA